MKCKVDGCERASHARGMCGMHYMRMKVYGETGSSVLVRHPREGDCTVDGCDNVRYNSRGWCNKHYARWRKYGDVSMTRVPRFPVPCSSTAHKRVVALRGKASSHECTDCGIRAAHWAYDHLDPGAVSDPEGPYSLDPNHYRPMCVPCHKRFDLARLCHA